MVIVAPGLLVAFAAFAAVALYLVSPPGQEASRQLAEEAGEAGNQAAKTIAEELNRIRQAAHNNTEKLVDIAPPVLSQTCPKPRDKSISKEKTKEDEGKKRRYAVSIHAQGTDCGGTTSSTIGAPAVNDSVPIIVAQGLQLSADTQSMLRGRQLEIRQNVIAKAHQYIETGPSVGGRFGQRSFPVLGVRGGIRYDVDCWGDGPSFIS